MALEISYWTGYDVTTREVYGRLISSETLATGASSAVSAVVPPNAGIARCEATVAAVRIANGAAAPVASPTNGAFVGLGAFIDVQVRPGEKIAAILA